MGAADEIQEAARLAAQAGLADVAAIERLAGGKNNQVWRVTLEDGDDAVFKRYFHDPRDTRDRLGAEWGFLTRAWARRVRAAPQPLAAEPENHIALYSFVPGRKLDQDEITAGHVADAASFIASVNGDPREVMTAPPGSEACFSLGDHIRAIDRRVARLQTLDAEAPHADAAAALVRDLLQPAWETQKARIAAAGGADPDAPFPESDLIVSPSDFGFHNALWSEEDGLIFLDFEYAGRDDPAKLTGDFFSCPEILTPVAHLDAFVDGIAGALGLSDAARARCALLLDAYRVKWTCIILNDFLPQDDARRAFANQGARDERCARQLEKAETKLSLIA